MANLDREDRLVQTVLVVSMEREEAKGIKGSEDPRVQPGLPVEPLESEGQRDPQGPLECQANQEYREFLGELGN